METKLDRKQKEMILLQAMWIFIIASALHFAYPLTKFFPLSFISAVNESVWEHVKIIFFGALIYDVYPYLRYYKGNRNFIFGLFLSLGSIVISVPFLYYGYTGITGTDYLLVSLIITFLSALLSQYILIRYAQSTKDYSRYRIFSLLMVLAMIAAFFLFTWYPPNLPLFKE